MDDLIQKIQSGDELAFKQLSQSIQGYLYNTARTRLNDDDDINDAIQNTMIITYQNAKKIKNVQYFKTWMIRVLINECNKIYNSNKKNNELINKVVTDNDFNFFDNSIHNVQSKINFDFLIDKLNYDEKIVIILYYNSQFSCSEIAKILNTSVNTVKSRLRRSKEKLKKFYEEGYLYDVK